MTSDGYVKVQSAPYAYNQRAEAKQDDPESAPLLWLSHPQVWGVARSGGTGRRVLHMFYGSVKTVDPQSEERWVLYGYEGEQP